jgi:hypothetical protein
MPAVVLGNVSVDDGSPLPRLESMYSVAGSAPSFVQINLETGIRTQAIVRSDGLVWFPAVSGEYHLNLTAMPVGYYIKSITYRATDLATKPMQLMEAVSSHIEVTLTKTPPQAASEGVQVSGRISGAPAAALAGKWVALPGTQSGTQFTRSEKLSCSRMEHSNSWPYIRVFTNWF